MGTPRLDECLAYAVLREPGRWLGLPSPSALDTFLAGAEHAAERAPNALAMWRIAGPMNQPSFSKPLVARTGHPTLSITWAKAMEMIHHEISVAMEELRQMVEDRFRSGDVPDGPLAKTLDIDPDVFWSGVARRPAMYMGGSTGWHLGWYLSGMTAGLEWLGCPPDPSASRLMKRIESDSRSGYGSTFAAYRVYSHANGAAELLRRAGVEPAP